MFDSCRTLKAVEPETSNEPFLHYAHFGVHDSAGLPDSIWFQNTQDSGSPKFYPTRDGRTTNIVFLPVLHPLGKDSLRVHAWRLGVHTGQYILKEIAYGELAETRFSRSRADSLAALLLGLHDSVLAARPPAPVENDSSKARAEAIFRQSVAELLYQGHPGTAAFRETPPQGLDTSDVVVRTLALARTSDRSLGELVRQWSLGMDYPTAKAALGQSGFDTSALNPFRMEPALRLDTLRLDEPAVGVWGKITNRLGVRSLKFSVTNDSGDRTDRFLLADAPAVDNQASLDLAGHPTFAPRASTALGRYTLRLSASDSVGNQASYSTVFWVLGALDHTGPTVESLTPDSAFTRPYRDSLLTLRLKVTDGSGVASVRIDTAKAVRGADGIWSATLLVPVSNTGRTIDIVATDSAKNPRTLQLAIRRLPPPAPTPPRVHLLSPRPNTLIPFDSTEVSVAWTVVTDFGQIDSVRIGGLPARNLHDSTWEARVPLPPDGKLADIGVRVHSSVPLATTDFVSVGRKADTSGPLVQWISPSQGHRVAYDTKSLDVRVSAADLSGIDSVRIGGKIPDSTHGIWQARVDLSEPGAITKIHILSWDHARNVSDSVLIVTRDPIPNQLPPSRRWIAPSAPTGTVVPFDSAFFTVRCVLTDISGIDPATVKIDDTLAVALDDSTWTRRVFLPPTGMEKIVTLDAKNRRGVSTSGFVSIVRRRDTLPPTLRRIALVPGATVPFDTQGVEIIWTGSDNDRIASAWIQGNSASTNDSTFHARVPLAVGSQWVRIRAQDPAGNVGWDSVLVERRADSIPPLLMRGPGTADRILAFDSSEIDVSWTISDNDRVAQAWIQGASVAAAGSVYRARVPLVVGRQWVHLRAEDATGNSTLDSIQVERGKDTSNPVAVRMQGTSNRVVAYDTSAIVVGWKATDNHRIDLAWIEGGLVQATSDGYSRPVGLAPGIQWIHFKAQDPAGNTAQDSIRVERLPMDTAASVEVSDTLSRLRGGSFDVTLRTTTPGAHIRYTLDGSEPTESSPEYGMEPVSRDPTGTARLHIDTTLTLKARVFAKNRAPGQILTQPYQLALPVAVCGGYFHSLFLLSDGSLWGVGSNQRNAFAPGNQTSYTRPVKIADSVLQMSAGYQFSVWVKQDGSLWGIGANDSGNLGVGSNVDLGTPTRITADVAKAVALHDRHLFVLKTDGSLWGAGSNLYGQLGTGDLISPNVLVRIASDVTRFGGGSAHSFFVKRDGSLWTMGSPFHGKLGFDTLGWVATPRKVADSISDVAETTGNSTFALTTSGKLLGFGWNHEGELGNGDTAFVTKPTLLPSFESQGRIIKVLSYNHTLALSENGTLWGTGHNICGQVHEGIGEVQVTPVPLMQQVQAFGIGAFHSFAITRSGCLWGWGANDRGQIGVAPQDQPLRITRVRF